MWGSGQVRGTFDKTKFTAAVTAANTGGFFGLSKDIGNNYNQCTQGNYTGMVSINEDNTDLRVGYGSGNSLANAELTSLQSGLKAVSAIVDTVKWESAGFGGSSQTANTCAWGFDLLMLPIDSALSPKAK